MMGKFRKITSGLLLLVFLLPSIVKAEHRHKRALFNVTDEKTHQRFSENCPVCNFEYSAFLANYTDNKLTDEYQTDSYCINYISRNNNNLNQFSFLLRAPPARQI
jgi:hypothetical protein